MKTKFYPVYRGGQRLGVYSEDEIDTLFNLGRILPTDNWYDEKSKNWQPFPITISGPSGGSTSGSILRSFGICIVTVVVLIILLGVFAVNSILGGGIVSFIVFGSFGWLFVRLCSDVHKIANRKD